MTRRWYASDYDGVCGGDCIQRAVDAADEDTGHGIVIVGSDGPDENGRWDLERAVELPSHTTLVLEGAHLRLVDGANDNLLRNRNVDAGDEEIHIVGRGSAHLDGNAENQDRDWDAVWLSYGVHFCGVDSLSIRGVAIGPTNCWALTLEAVRDIRVSDIEFAQDGRTENQDGLHVLGPARRVTVDGVTGATGDDVIALNAATSEDFGRRENGPIRGVVITNVAIDNAFSTGLVRTVADRGGPVNGVYASNLAMTGGTEVGDAVLKIGWAGAGVDEPPRFEDHRDITIENVFVEEWDAPYCVTQAPVRNLTLRGLRGRHSGPLFYNLENDLDGVFIEDCRTALVGDPPGTVINDYYSTHLENERFTASVLDRTPGIVSLSDATCRDVRVIDSHFETDVADPASAVGLRVYGGVEMADLTLRDTTFREFGSGIIVERDAEVTGTTTAGVRLSDIDDPWAIPSDLSVRGSGNIPPRRLFDERLRLDGGERRTVVAPGIPAAALDALQIDAVPESPAGDEHGYRIDAVGIADGEVRFTVVETAEGRGGVVRVVAAET